MSSAPQRFRQAEIQRTGKALRGLGLEVGTLEVFPDGRIRVTPKPAERALDPQPSKDEDDDERRRRHHP
jgi:hypothetical protein